MESRSLAIESFDEITAEDDTVRKLVDQTGTFGPSDFGALVLQFFKEHYGAEGVVVVEADKPVGIIMRNDFFQKLGSLFGRALFMRRPVRLLMNADPLIVDVSVNISSISTIAMNRDHQQLYDLVVITENESYTGVVSIKRFMMELLSQRGREIELLKRQKEILNRANEDEIRYSKQIETANNALREKNDAIKNLFDNAGQGFLSFGDDLIISEEYSLECVEIFRGPIGGKSFIELMEKHVPDETAQTISSVMKGLFSSLKALQQKVYLSLMPDEITIYKKAIRFECKLIQHLGKKRLMLVLTDITEKRNLELKMEEEKLNLKMVVKAISRQSDVIAAIDEFRAFANEDARAIIQRSENFSVAHAELFRSIHTFKGDFAQLGLHNTSAGLHEMEDELAALTYIKNPPPDELLSVVNKWDTKAVLRTDLSVISQTLGRSFFDGEETFRIGKDKLIEIEYRVAQAVSGEEQNELIDLIRSLRLQNLKDLLRSYNDYLLPLAERLGKSVRPLQISGDDILIDKEAYVGFIKILSHIFRNMIDHGIENVEERIEAQKRESGSIECRLSRQGDSDLRLSISDDGRGIDIEKVRGMALQKGILGAETASAMPPGEIYDLLFLDSFSTKENVTALSGRGVGLAAVKAETEKLNGRIFVDSEPGHGSRFTFILPIIAGSIPARKQATL